jgi:hypothetical protein
VTGGPPTVTGFGMEASSKGYLIAHWWPVELIPSTTLVCDPRRLQSLVFESEMRRHDTYSPQIVLIAALDKVSLDYLRYYGAVRLLQNVHVRIMDLSAFRTGLLAQTL